VISSEVEESRCAASSYRRGLLRPRRLSGLRMMQTANPTAAEHNVTVINNRSLPGRYRALRVVQLDMCAMIFQWRNCRNRSGMIIADVDGGFERRAPRSAIEGGLVASPFRRERVG